MPKCIGKRGDGSPCVRNVSHPSVLCYWHRDQACSSLDPNNGRGHTHLKTPVDGCPHTEANMPRTPNQALLIRAHSTLHRILADESIDLPSSYTEEALLEELRRTFTQREMDFDELPALTREAIVEDAQVSLAETYHWTCEEAA